MNFQTFHKGLFTLLTLRKGLPKWLDRSLYWLYIALFALSLIFHSLYVRYKRQESLGEAGIAIVFICVTGVATVKLFSFASQIDHVNRVLDDIFTEKETGFAKTTKMITGVFYFMGFVGTVFWFTYPLFMETIILPTPMYIPFGSSEGYVFLAKYLFDVAATFSMASIQIAIDNTFMLMAARLCDKAERLAILIRNINRKSNNKLLNDAETNFGKAYYLHKEIIDEFKTLAAIVSPVFLCQVLQSIVMSCIMSLIITKAKSPVDILKGLLSIIIAFYELFCYCYFGQKITDRMECLHYELFWSGWETNTIKHKKSVLIALGETWNPPVMKGASLYQVTLRTYMWAMKESLSYYMFLRTVTIKKNAQLY